MFAEISRAALGIGMVVVWAVFAAGMGYALIKEEKLARKRWDYCPDCKRFWTADGDYRQWISGAATHKRCGRCAGAAEEARWIRRYEERVQQSEHRTSNVEH